MSRKRWVVVLVVVAGGCVLPVVALRVWTGRAAEATHARIDALYAEHGVPTDAAALATAGDPGTDAFLAAVPELWGEFNPYLVTGEWAREPGPAQAWPAWQVAAMRWSLARHETDWARSDTAHAAGLRLGFDPGEIGPMSKLRRWARVYQTKATVEAATHGFAAGVPWMLRTLDLADASLREPGTFQQLVGGTIVALVTSWVQEELARFPADAASL